MVYISLREKWKAAFCLSLTIWKISRPNKDPGNITFYTCLANKSKLIFILSQTPPKAMLVGLAAKCMDLRLTAWVQILDRPLSSCQRLSKSHSLFRSQRIIPYGLLWGFNEWKDVKMHRAVPGTERSTCKWKWWWRWDDISLEICPCLKVLILPRMNSSWLPKK